VGRKETFPREDTFDNLSSTEIAITGTQNNKGSRMEQEMEGVVMPAEMKTRRSMSIHSICDPLASSTSSLSDHDSEATLTFNERTSMDEMPKMDSLSPSEEQAVRALEDLRAGISSWDAC
jgi:hypothetical protein